VIRFLALVMQIMCTLTFIRALFMNTRSQVGSSTFYRKSFIATSVFGVAAFTCGYFVFSLG
jgi:hypothetical protein